MNVQRRAILVSFVVIALALGSAVVLAREELSRFAFRVTGEEEYAGQLRGLAQLSLNFARPPLQLEPYAPVEHAAISPFGINTFLHQEVEIAKREEQLRLISEAGFDWIRQEFPWEDIEISAKGDFIDRRNDPEGIDAWAKYDNIVGLAEQYDVDIIARVGNPPSWSRSAPDEEVGSFAPPDDYGDFADFVNILAERYEGSIRYYQVWNEPNCCQEWGINQISPEEYTELLCRSYEAIKAANPDAVVLSAALSPTNELSNQAFNDFLFLQRMYDAGAGACFDVLSMQGYGLWSGPTDRRLQPITVNYSRPLYIRDLMVRNGDANKAIWLSEMNWNAAPEGVEPRFGRVTLDQQARWAPLAYQRAQREWPWVGVVNFWYFKRADDQWLREQRPEAYFQMAEPDFTLMPVYETMQAYTSQPSVIYKGNHPPDHWAVDYGRGEEPVEFLFQGHTLEVVISSTESFECGAVLRVNQGEPRRVDECAGTIIWRGSNDRNSADVELIGSTHIDRIIVRDDPRPLPYIVMGGVFVVMMGGALILRLRFGLPLEGEL